MRKRNPTTKDMPKGKVQHGNPVPSWHDVDPRQHQPLSRRYRKPAEHLADAVGKGDQDVEESTGSGTCCQDAAKKIQDGDNNDEEG